MHKTNVNSGNDIQYKICYEQKNCDALGVSNCVQSFYMQIIFLNFDNTKACNIHITSFE